jgi:hypothetical protein
MTHQREMPVEVKEVVRHALNSVGYGQNLIGFDFPFVVEPSHELSSQRTAPIVAFWDETQDQYSSSIAVCWVPEDRVPNTYLELARTDLWAPFTLVTSTSACTLWETLPTGAVEDGTPFRYLDQARNYQDIPELFSKHKPQLEPQAIARRKKQWRQMALYEVSPEPNAFLQWAYKPTRERVTKVFTRLLQEALALAEGGERPHSTYLQWVLRMVGVRLVWDKRWVDDVGNRASPEDIFRAACGYPTVLQDLGEPKVNAGLAVANLVVDHLQMMDLRAIDRGILSQIVHGQGLPKELQQRWKLYPTPSDLAWRMLQGLPIEALPEAERRVWDGTCGTGTFLATAIDRLRELVPHMHGEELRVYLTSAVGGNEIRPALADATRVALDQALGAKAGSKWQITEEDVRSTQPRVGANVPTIVLGNPPFEGKGKSGDVSSEIIDDYLAALPAGGLLGVVAPRTMLGTDSAIPVRRRLLLKFDLIEVWELGPRTFARTDTETAVLLGRRHASEGEKRQNSVTWRVLDSSRTEQWIDAAVQERWFSTERADIQSPLALRLNDCFANFRRFGDLIPREDRSQGITPGASGKVDILEYPVGDAEPYLVGAKDIKPFHISWVEDRHWIRHQSPRLHRSRPEHWPLFRGPKILISRQATRSATWRIKAAADNRGLFPSDRFWAIKPPRSFSLELAAGILNSLLTNAWIRLINPAFNVRLDSLLGTCSIGRGKS